MRLRRVASSSRCWWPWLRRRPPLAAPSLAPFVSLGAAQTTFAGAPAGDHAPRVRRREDGAGPAGGRRRAAADAVPERHVDRALVRERARAALGRLRGRLRAERQVLRLLHVEPERRPRDLGVHALAGEPERGRRLDGRGASSRSRTRASPTTTAGSSSGTTGTSGPGPGDGGGGGDQSNNAQNPAVLLGKLLRIDPAGPTVTIAAIGLRNPWRFSFDRAGSGELRDRRRRPEPLRGSRRRPRHQLRLAVLRGAAHLRHLAAALRRRRRAHPAAREAAHAGLLLDHRRLRRPRPGPARPCSASTSTATTAPRRSAPSTSTNAATDASIGVSRALARVLRRGRLRPHPRRPADRHDLAPRSTARCAPATAPTRTRTRPPRRPRARRPRARRPSPVAEPEPEPVAVAQPVAVAAAVADRRPARRDAVADPSASPTPTPSPSPPTPPRPPRRRRPPRSAARPLRRRPRLIAPSRSRARSRCASPACNSLAEAPLSLRRAAHGPHAAA